MVSKPYTGCIYLAINAATGIAYIGKTNRGLDARRKHHEQAAARGKGADFARAIREYGPDAFSWSELFLSDDDAALLAAEVEIIGWYGRDALYNLCAGGQGPTGIVWTDERRQRFAEKRKGMKFSEAHKLSMSEARIGFKMAPWTEERRAKVAAAWAAKTDRSQTAEHRAKLSAAAKARWDREDHSGLQKAGRAGAAARWGKP